MKNNNLIQEEINRAKQLWGYDTSKTIFEQFTGNTGTTGGPMSATINKCSGGTFSTWYSVTLNGNNLTQSDIGKTIMSTNPGFPLHGTLTAISPSTGIGFSATKFPSLKVVRKISSQPSLFKSTSAMLMACLPLRSATSLKTFLKLIP